MKSPENHWEGSCTHRALRSPSNYTVLKEVPNKHFLVRAKDCLKTIFFSGAS